MPFVHHRVSLSLSAAVMAGLVLCGACQRRDAGASAETSRAAVAPVGAPIRIPPDDFGDTLPTGLAPRRIVSLNPATTELFFALGAGDRLVGRTHYDLYPSEASRIPDLGNGMRPNI